MCRDQTRCHPLWKETAEGEGRSGIQGKGRMPGMLPADLNTEKPATTERYHLRICRVMAQGQSYRMSDISDSPGPKVNSRQMHEVV